MLPAIQPPLTSSAGGVTAIYMRDGLCAEGDSLGSGTRVVFGHSPSNIEILAPTPACSFAPDTLLLLVDETISPPLRACDACDPFLYGIGVSLRAGLRRYLRPPPKYLESLARPLSSHLSRYYGNARRREASGLSAARLDRVLAYIDQNLAGSCALGELAEVAHLSAFHFSRMFRRSTGKSPHAYLVGRRMERARQLLVETPTPIGEIARMVGFQTQSHFTNAFRHANGLAPGAYRARGRLASMSAREID